MPDFTFSRPIFPHRLKSARSSAVFRNGGWAASRPAPGPSSLELCPFAGVDFLAGLDRFRWRFPTQGLRLSLTPQPANGWR